MMKKPTFTPTRLVLALAMTLATLAASAQTDSKSTVMIDSLINTLSRLGMMTDKTQSTHSGSLTIQNTAVLGVPSIANIMSEMKPGEVDTQDYQRQVDATTA